MNKRIFKIIFFNLISLLFFGGTFLAQIPAGVLAANPIPNCQVDGPDSGTVGSELTFTALYRTTLDGRFSNAYGDIAVRHNGDFPLLQSTSWALRDYSTRDTLRWTPSAAGTYQVFCRASNGIDFECVGNGPTTNPNDDLEYANDNHSYYGDPPSSGRHHCGSILAHHEVVISAPAARDTTPPVTTPSASSTTRRTGDVVSVNLSATDSGGSGVKQITWGLFPGATDCSSAQIDPIYTSGRSTSGVISGGSGSVPNITVPSCLQYWAEDNASNKENNGIGLNFPVNSNSSRTSTLSSIDPATGYRYGQSVTVNFSSTGTGTIHTTVWPGISTCNETDKNSVTFQYQGLTSPSASRTIAVPSCIEYKTDDETTAHQYILGPADATRPVTTFTLVSHGGDRSQVISNEMQQVRFDTTYDRPPIRYISVTAVKVPGATDLASARSQAVVDSGWAGANRHYDSGQVVDIRAPFYVQFQAVASDGNIEPVREDFVPGIPETTASVWIAESQANLDACATDASKCTKIAYTAGMTTATYRFSSIGSRRLFVRYVSNANSPRDDDINAAGGLAISYVANPDCYIASGPDTVYTGQTAVYTGQYSLTPGTAGDHLDGDIVVKQGGSIVACEAASDTDSSCNGKEISGFGGSHNFSWRPTAVGSYEIFCRAFNRGKLECDGNLSAASGAVRACPNNATGHKTVNVVRDDTPPTTTVTQSRTTGLSKGDLVDITFAASDPESGISQTTVTIWPNKKNRPAGVAETYYCPSPDATKCPAEWHWGVSGGTIPNLPVPSYIEYNAVNGSGKEEKDAHPEGFIAHRILSDDSEKPTSTVSGPAGRTGYGRNEAVPVHITAHDNRGIGAVFVAVWSGNDKSGTLAPIITINGNNQTDIAQDVTPTTKAPYYMEVRAIDRNGNVEDASGTDAVDGQDSDNPGHVHAFKTLLDTTVPNATTVTPDKTTNINNNDSVTLHFAGSDNTGGSGVAVIYVTVWPGAKSATDRDAKAAAGHPITSQNKTIAAAAGDAIVTVPSYIEYNAQDKAGNTETGSDTGKPLSVLSDDSEKPTSTVSGPSGRSGFYPGEAVALSVEARDNRKVRGVEMSVWQGISNASEKWDPGTTAPTGKSFKSGIDLSHHIGTGDGKTAAWSDEVTGLTAPFYMEYQAVDINGNIEGDGSSPHTFTVPMDTTVPSVTVSALPSPRDNDSTIELTVSGADESGGSGLAATWVTIWEGAKDANGKFNDGKTSDSGLKQPTYACPSGRHETTGGITISAPCPFSGWGVGGGTARVKVPSLVEYNAVDRAGNWNKLVASGEGVQLMVLNDDNGSDKRPTSAMTASPASGFRKDQDVTMTFEARDNRDTSSKAGTRLIYVTVWEGVAGREQLLAKYNNDGNAINAAAVHKDITGPRGTVTAKVPFYVQWQALDINDNIEDDTGSDKVDNGSGFGAHSFGADFPEEAATVRIAESEAALADSGTHSDFPFNPTVPIITYNFSGGLSPGSTKTLFAKFISNKNHSSAVLSIGSVHRLASGEGTAFSFSPASGSFMVGGSALDVAVQLNTNVPTIRNYNISAVDVLIKVSDSRFFSSFDPSSSSGLITLANTNNVTAGQTTIHYIGYRTSSTDVKGTVSLGTIHLLAPAGTSGTSLSVSTSIDGTPKLTSTDVSGPVPVGSSGSGTYSVIQPTNTPTLTPTLTPTATLTPVATASPTGAVTATLSPTGRVSAPPVTTSPALSPTGRITSPPGRLACDFNQNGVYDDTTSDPVNRPSDLDIWTQVVLGVRAISGTDTLHGFSWDADCAGDGIDSADTRVDILDLNRWRRLKYGL